MAKQKIKLIYTMNIDSLVDVVLKDNESVFLILDENGTDLFVPSHVEFNNEKYLPPPISNVPWLMPRYEKILFYYKQYIDGDVAKLNKALFNELIEYHKNISELPSDDYYKLIAAWVVHTYLLQHFEYTPILLLFAVPERGKSRTGKGMIYVSFRGIHVETLREAHLIRFASDYKATLFIDVKDLWKKASLNQSEDILLLRYEKGARVPRVHHPEKGPIVDMVFYDIFGPTIIGTNTETHKILETRSVQLDMPQSNKLFDNLVKEKNALELREKLTAFRAYYLRKGLPEVEKPVKGRRGDILRPLMQVIALMNPEGDTASMADLFKESSRKELAEESTSLEAEILETIDKLKSKITNATLAVKDITDKININRIGRYQYTYHLIGHRLNDLGFQKIRSSEGNARIIIDENNLNLLKNKYGLVQTPVTQVSPVMPETFVFTGVTGDTGLTGHAQE